MLHRRKVLRSDNSGPDAYRLLRRKKLAYYKATKDDLLDLCKSTSKFKTKTSKELASIGFPLQSLYCFSCGVKEGDREEEAGASPSAYSKFTYIKMQAPQETVQGQHHSWDVPETTQAEANR